MLYWYVGAFNRCSSREEQYLRWLLLYKNYILDCRQTTKFNSSIMKVELFILMRKSFSAFNFFQLLMKLVSSCYTSLWTQCICQINFPCLLQIRLRKSSRWNYIGFLTVSCKYHNWFLNVFFFNSSMMVVFCTVFSLFQLFEELLHSVLFFKQNRILICRFKQF